MRDSRCAGKCRRKGVSAIGTQHVRVAQFASPTPGNIRARHAPRVREGRGRNHRARCSHHQPSARQASAPKIAKFHSSGCVLFQSLLIIERQNKVVDSLPSFYALERHRWRFSRRFKIIVAQDALCGALIVPPRRDVRSASFSRQVVSFPHQIRRNRLSGVRKTRFARLYECANLSCIGGLLSAADQLVDVLAKMRTLGVPIQTKD